MTVPPKQFVENQVTRMRMLSTHPPSFLTSTAPGASRVCNTKQRWGWREDEVPCSAAAEARWADLPGSRPGLQERTGQTAVHAQTARRAGHILTPPGADSTGKHTDGRSLRLTARANTPEASTLRVRSEQRRQLWGRGRRMRSCASAHMRTRLPLGLPVTSGSQGPSNSPATCLAQNSAAAVIELSTLTSLLLRHRHIYSFKRNLSSSENHTEHVHHWLGHRSQLVPFG